MEYVHADEVGGSCLTTDCWPPTVTCPVRLVPPLGLTRKLTEPLPDPLTGCVSEIQLTSVVTVHAHSAAVAIVTLPGPPSEPTLRVAGLMVMTQGARCDTRTFVSLTAISPSRAAFPLLAVMR